MTERLLTVEILREGEVHEKEAELYYNKGGDEIKCVNLLQLVRDRLCDQTLNMQVHISDARPTREINWRHVILQLENSTAKSTLDRLRDDAKYVIINTTYRRVPIYRDVMAERCDLYK